MVARTVVAPEQQFIKTRFLYTIAEAAELLSLSRSTLYKLISSGALKSRKVRRRRMVPRSSIESFCKTDHAAE